MPRARSRFTLGWRVPKPSHPARAQIAAEAVAGHDARELLRRVVPAFARALPFDAAGFCPTDPDTLLWTGGLVTGLPAESVPEFFESELLAGDPLNFRDMLARGRVAGTLAEATGGVLERSPRYRRMYAPRGIGAELRLAFTVDGRCWGTACLLRERAEFTREEVAFAAAAARDVAGGLRAAAARCGAAAGPDAPGAAARGATANPDAPGAAVRAAATANPGAPGAAARGATANPDAPGAAARDAAPGVLVVDDHLRVLSYTDPAACWLQELRVEDPTAESGLPSVIYSVVGRARRAAAGEPGPPPRARLRTAAGRWVTVDATALSGDQRAWAVTLAPTRPSEALRLMAEGHDLTPREQQVLGLLLRGRPDRAIAAELVVSLHTAREHARRVLQKFGARSRGELQALLFEQHYDPWSERLSADAA